MPRGRPKKVIVFPLGLHQGQPVKVTCVEYDKPKLGLVAEICKYDGGIRVWLTAESRNGVSKYVCIQPERGDTIEGIEIESRKDTRSSISGG